MLRLLLAALILLPLPLEALELLTFPREMAQGELRAFELRATGVPRARFDGAIAFFKGGKRWKGIVAVDLEAKPGPRTLVLEDRGERRTLRLVVQKKAFPLQRLTLPKEMVELDEGALRRVRKERALLREVLSSFRARPLWKAPFLLPLRGRLTGPFGLRRVVNGRFMTRHRGLDIAAPEGTPVVATNEGVVVLVAPLFLEGRTVIIDHGLGLFSLYLHLKEAFVREGERVNRGQRIGAVGETGRTKAPHLHWGVVFRGQKVDPLSLLESLGEKGWRRGLSRRP